MLLPARLAPGHLRPRQQNQDNEQVSTHLDRKLGSHLDRQLLVRVSK